MPIQMLEEIVKKLKYRDHKWCIYICMLYTHSTMSPCSLIPSHLSNWLRISCLPAVSYGGSDGLDALRSTQCEQSSHSMKLMINPLLSSLVMDACYHGSSDPLENMRLSTFN